jgi:asparagine synthase (glutamine-hydrolysing)
MCGIAGIISFNVPIDASFINMMTDVVPYRGPDDEGAVLLSNDLHSGIEFRRAEELKSVRRGKILFGHRRLSIIDLTEAGHQPMSYANGESWIIYNGEIYNYIELQEELAQLGYHFKTRTDTEIILAAYMEWGEDCLHRFNGMWSFAIFDAIRNVIFCSCDQFGIKPFYYYHDDNGFYFGSEIKQLLALPWIEKRADRGSLFDLLGSYPRPDYSENTLFKNVKRLLAGDKITISNLSSTNPKVQIKKWHEFDTIPKDYSITEDAAIRNLVELFYDSVRLRLRSDVPIGTALSGGIDSSAIVLVMNKIVNESNTKAIQKTFTVGSEDSNIDETEFAKEIIRCTAAEAYFTIPSADGLLGDLEDMLYHLEEPFQTTSCYASWCVYRLAKESGVTVTLDGQGSDEILGGYDIYNYPFYLIESFSSGKIGDFLRTMNGTRRICQYSYLTQLTEMAKQSIKLNNRIRANYEHMRVKRDDILKSEFIEEGLRLSRAFWLIDSNSCPFSKLLKNAYSNRLKQDFYVGGLQDLLRVVDRNSMAHSIEARVPYLDYRLVEFVFSLPHNLKVKNGTTKYLLRKAFNSILPKNILIRTKLGFVTAESLWFYSARNTLRELLFSHSHRLKDIVEIDRFDNLFQLDNHQNLVTNKIWKYLSIAMILDKFNLTV